MPKPTVQFQSECRMPKNNEEFRMRVYHEHKEGGVKEHVAIIKGNVQNLIDNVVRIHSSCTTSEVFGCERCDCKEQLDYAFDEISNASSGAIVYLDQEGRDIGLAKKVAAYAMQDEGYNTAEANTVLGLDVDSRNFQPAIDIMHDLGIKATRLLTNNPDKINAVANSGIHITVRQPVVIDTKSDYQSKKASIFQHLFDFNVERDVTPVPRESAPSSSNSTAEASSESTSSIAQILELSLAKS